MAHNGAIQIMYKYNKHITFVVYLRRKVDIFIYSYVFAVFLHDWF